jgi:hypothetical protein
MEQNKTREADSSSVGQQISRHLLNLNVFIRVDGLYSACLIHLYTILLEDLL